MVEAGFWTEARRAFAEKADLIMFQMLFAACVASEYFVTLPMWARVSGWAGLVALVVFGLWVAPPKNRGE